MYSIYKIEFQDGFAYVGMTKYPLQDRIRRHIGSPDNAELKRRLETDPYTAEVMYTGIPTAEIAYQIEDAEIKQLLKPINISGVSPDAVKRDFGHAQNDTRPTHIKKRKKRNVFPPREGNYRCSICRVFKPHTEFPLDRSRFNGLNSRCKPCYRIRRGYIPEPITPQNTLTVCKFQIGRLLRKTRLEKGMTTVELAALWGVEKHYKSHPSNVVVRWEIREDPPLHRLKWVAEFCNVPIHVLQEMKGRQVHND